MLRVGSIVIRVDDLQRQAQFSAAALDPRRARVRATTISGDQAGEVERLVSLGATEVHWDSDRPTPTM